MPLALLPGRYVVAVSGGVDSLALLHMLQQDPRLKLTVAHFDHGIRQDSAADRRHVQEYARRHGLPFVYNEGKMGPKASEAAAREARYAFLRDVRQASGARAIITAHHQDDVLETAILNLIRGTGRRGLTSLHAKSDIERPLLHLPKVHLKAYALDQGLRWREDSTNTDQRYARNYVRRQILPRLDHLSQAKLVEILIKLAATNAELDRLLINQLHLQEKSGMLGRQWFASLPHDISKEVLMAWLRSQNVRGFDKKTIERSVIAAKTYQVGKQIDIMNGVTLKVGKDNLALYMLER